MESPLSATPHPATLVTMDPLIRGWGALQQFAHAASGQHRFYWPKTTNTVMFLGQPMAAVIGTNYQVISRPTPDQIANVHVLINAFVPELGAVKIVAGDANLYYQLLQAYFEHGVADRSYTLEAHTARLRPNHVYMGPQLRIAPNNKINAAEQAKLAKLELHDLQHADVLTAYVALLQSEATTNVVD